MAAISPYSHKDNPTNKTQFPLIFWLRHRRLVYQNHTTSILVSSVSIGRLLSCFAIIRLRVSPCRLGTGRCYHSLIGTTTCLIILSTCIILPKHICRYNAAGVGKGEQYQPQKRLLLYPKGRREATGGEQGLRSPDCDVTGHCFTIKLVHQDYCFFVCLSQPFVRILYHNFC